MSSVVPETVADQEQLKVWAEEYLELATAIEEAKSRQQQLKDNLNGVLSATATPGAKWILGRAKAEWVKGRKGSAKIVAAKLVQKGVTPDIIEYATEKGEDGQPSLRISSVDVEPFGA